MTADRLRGRCRAPSRRAGLPRVPHRGVCCRLAVEAKGFSSTRACGGEHLQRNLDVRLRERKVDDDLDAVISQQFVDRSDAAIPYLAPAPSRGRVDVRTNRTSRSGNVVRLSRYWLLMTPAPMTPLRPCRRLRLRSCRFSVVRRCSCPRSPAVVAARVVELDDLQGVRSPARDRRDGGNRRRRD